MNHSVDQALAILRDGGVIAYPTEFCFGLGCDPRNESAVQRILNIKRRDVAQGLILVAADEAQVGEYAALEELERIAQIRASWPGPNTWVLPITGSTPAWISGQHDSVAMRITDHPIAADLCRQFGGAIVSTSANRHGAETLLTAEQVEQEMGQEVDLVVHGELSEANGSRLASTLQHAISGEVLR